MIIQATSENPFGQFVPIDLIFGVRLHQKWLGLLKNYFSSKYFAFFTRKTIFEQT